MLYRVLFLAAAFSMLTFLSPALGHVRLSKTPAPSGQITDAGTDSTTPCGPTLDGGAPGPGGWAPVRGGIRYGEDGGLASVFNFGAGTIGAQSIGAGSMTSGYMSTTDLLADTANINTLTVGLIGATKIVTSQLVVPRVSTTSYSNSVPGNATLNTLSGRSAIPPLDSSVKISNSLVRSTTIIACGLETPLGPGTAPLVCTPALGGGSFTCTMAGAGFKYAVHFWWMLQ